MAAYLLESAFCLACFYGFYYAFLRKETFFQLNRLYLVSTPLLAFVLPALHIRLEKQSAPSPADIPTADAQPVWPELVQQAQAAPMTVRQELSNTLGAWAISLADVMIWVYAIGVLALTILLACRLYGLQQTIRKSRLERMQGATLARPQEGSMPLASFFGFVFWNEDDLPADEQKHVMFEHELVHVRQWHSVDVLLMELLLILQWFNPLMHTFRRSLCVVHEYIADDYIVKYKQSRYSYATLLARQISRGIAQPSAPVNTFHSLLKLRLKMLAKHPSHPLKRAKYLLGIPMLAGLMLLFSFRLVETMPAAAPLRNLTQMVENYVATLDEISIVANRPTPPLPPEPTPYIFYWGAMQAYIFKNDGANTYTADLTISADEFRESFKREPRLWDGHTLQQHFSLNVEGLTVNSDYYNEDVYGKTRKNLEEKYSPLQNGTALELNNITMPDGGKLTIHVTIDGKTPNWLPKNAGETNGILNPMIGSMILSANTDLGAKDLPLNLAFGSKSIDADRQFYTVSEFWDIFKNAGEPTASINGQQASAESMKLMVANPTEIPNRIILPRVDDHNMTMADVKTKLEDISDKIKPGVTVQIICRFNLQAPWAKDTIIDMTAGNQKVVIMDHNSQYFTFDLVPDGDPRLELRRSQRQNFSIEWGNMGRKFISRYGRSFPGETTDHLFADRPDFYQSNYMTKKEILNMFTLPVRVSRGTELLSDINVQLEFKGTKVDAPNGHVPESFINLVQQQMQPQDFVTITGLTAAHGDIDLGQVVIQIDCRSDDPKPALRPAASSSSTEAIDLHASPDASLALVRFYYTLPQAGKGVLLVTNIQGQSVYQIETEFQAGAGTYTIPYRDLRVKGTFAVSLQMPYGKTSKTFVVQ